MIPYSYESQDVKLQKSLRFFQSSRQFHFAAVLESQHTCTHSTVRPVVECPGADLAEC